MQRFKAYKGGSGPPHPLVFKPLFFNLLIFIIMEAQEKKPVFYMGKPALMLHSDPKRSIIVMEKSGAVAVVQNKNLKSRKTDFYPFIF